MDSHEAKLDAIAAGKTAAVSVDMSDPEIRQINRSKCDTEVAQCKLPSLGLTGTDDGSGRTIESAHGVLKELPTKQSAGKAAK